MYDLNWIGCTKYKERICVFVYESGGSWSFLSELGSNGHIHNIDAFGKVLSTNLETLAAFDTQLDLRFTRVIEFVL